MVMAKQEAISRVVMVAVVGSVAAGLASGAFDRTWDAIFPPAAQPAEAASVETRSGRTTVTYANDVELVARPNLRAWGSGRSAEALATATRDRVADGLQLPAELAATQIHYRISDVAFGAQGKQTANVQFAMMERQRGEIRCGPVSLAFRDAGDLSRQVQRQLNAILFQSYTGGRLSCG
jgi:hypothetical protein